MSTVSQHVGDFLGLDSALRPQVLVEVSSVPGIDLDYAREHRELRASDPTLFPTFLMLATPHQTYVWEQPWDLSREVHVFDSAEVFDKTSGRDQSIQTADRYSLEFIVGAWLRQRAYDKGGETLALLPEDFRQLGLAQKLCGGRVLVPPF